MTHAYSKLLSRDLRIGLSEPFVYLYCFLVLQKEIYEGEVSY